MDGQQGRLGRWAAHWLLGIALLLGAGMAAAQAGFTRHGTWWNPAEPGTGFFFEAQGGQAIATFFVYDRDGKPVWYSAPGTLADNGSGSHRFQGSLLQFTDGPVVNDADSVRAPIAQTAGQVTIVFSGGQAQVQLPLRSFAAVKYATRPAAPRTAGGVIPETGIYWDPSGSGRGFTIEADGDAVTMGIYAFDANGYPTWRLAVLPLEAAPVKVRPTVFSNGQTLDGAFRAPTSAAAPTAWDDITVAFEGACFTAVSANGTMSLERFAFGGTACRDANKVAPAARKMLPPELPGDTLLTSQQVRLLAARVIHFTDTLPFHDQQVAYMHDKGKEIAPDGWYKTPCTQSGVSWHERQDPDNDKLLSTGDIVWFEYEDCKGPASTPAGASITWDGWMRSIFDHVSTGDYTSRLTYFWLSSTNSVMGQTWHNGTVRLNARLNFLSIQFRFEGLLMEAGTTGTRIAAKSGTVSQVGHQFFLETKYQDLDMRLGLDGNTRIKARVGLLDPARPLLMDREYRVADVAQQGVVVIQLEPGRPEGYQIHLRAAALDTFELQYRRGSAILSTQTVARDELRAAGRP